MHMISSGTYFPFILGIPISLIVCLSMLQLVFNLQKSWVIKSCDDGLYIKKSSPMNKQKSETNKEILLAYSSIQSFYLYKGPIDKSLPGSPNTHEDVVVLVILLGDDYYECKRKFISSRDEQSKESTFQDSTVIFDDKLRRVFVDWKTPRKRIRPGIEVVEDILISAGVERYAPQLLEDKGAYDPLIGDDVIYKYISKKKGL